MTEMSPDRELLDRLVAIPEIADAGFQVREGLTGAGVTVLKGRVYFGSWRVTAGALCWIQAAQHTEASIAESVDDAVRRTLLAILRSLETHLTARPLSAAG